MIKAKTPRPTKMPVSNATVTKAATRLLSQRLVSAEIAYVQRTLGNTSTQDEIDAAVIAVRKLPWASIVVAD